MSHDILFIVHKKSNTSGIFLQDAVTIQEQQLQFAKVKAYGVQEPALQLLRSYLHGRKQRVICNNKCSSWSPVRCGVPQGSLLIPLLFNIFMNDINETVTVSSLRLYADDTTQYTADYSPVVLQHLLNQDMAKLSSWFASNYLQANEDKTQSSDDPWELILSI